MSVRCSLYIMRRHLLFTLVDLWYKFEATKQIPKIYIFYSLSTSILGYLHFPTTIERINILRSVPRLFLRKYFVSHTKVLNKNWVLAPQICEPAAKIFFTQQSKNKIYGFIILIVFLLLQRRCPYGCNITLLNYPTKVDLRYARRT